MAQLTSTTVTGNLAVTGTILANEIKNASGKKYQTETEVAAAIEAAIGSALAASY